MKTLSANLKSHIAGEVTTLATLWKVTRTDATVFGFTDHSDDITYGGTTYDAATGYTPSNIETTASLGVDNLDVQAVLDSASITDADLMAGLWDYATVEIVRVNYKSLGDGHEWMRRGTLGNVSTGRTAFVAELRGMTQPLQQSIGRIFAPACDAALGDARCGITLGTYTVTGTLTAVASGHQFTDSARAEAAGYFNGGLLTWTGGANAGYAMEVKSFAAGVFVIQQAMPTTPSIGDTYSVSAGCDKTLATCGTKFANVVNFRGFPHVPGMDSMMSGK
jgi:uncharacterized phage protein (TIGR02218 family)